MPVVTGGMYLTDVLKPVLYLEHNQIWCKLCPDQANSACASCVTARVQVTSSRLLNMQACVQQTSTMLCVTLHGSDTLTLENRRMLAY